MSKKEPETIEILGRKDSAVKEEDFNFVEEKSAEYQKSPSDSRVRYRLVPPSLLEDHPELENDSKAFMANQTAEREEPIHFQIASEPRTTAPTIKPKHKRKWPWVLLIIAVIIVALTLIYLFSPHFSLADKQYSTLEMHPHQVCCSIHTTAADKGSVGVIPCQLDSINDVLFNIYSLPASGVELRIGEPEAIDDDVLLMITAADTRADNNAIVGDYVYKGEVISHGKGKRGYCAIVDNNIFIGSSLDDRMMHYAIEHRGYFFRQYVLVQDGEMQEIPLKGKSIRRALALKDGMFYFVETTNRESLYDFASALADYGYSDALYLVGGQSKRLYRTADGIQVAGNEKTTTNTNYIVFKCK